MSSFLSCRCCRAFLFPASLANLYARRNFAPGITVLVLIPLITGVAFLSTICSREHRCFLRYWILHPYTNSKLSNHHSLLPMASQHHGLDGPTLHTLANKAIEAKKYAYCPYSRFRVGASVLVSTPSTSNLTLGTDRIFFTGANVEVASTPVGIVSI